ncbi:RtcB family protein [Candidatus Dojkabacteria bacterium]|nr:RtcB family protein [Candidatus Dojkabacteria bacterium]
MEIITANTKIPIHTWIPFDQLDQKTVQQVENIANLPFAYHHVALMPDAHVGYGMPIGGILATNEYIVPNAVGVDIGCGMVAVRTSINLDEFLEKRDQIAHQIARSIPRGFHKHKTPQDHPFFNSLPDLKIIQDEIPTITRQIGTLGGGNHFIDILYDEDEFIWIMIHSGSRNIGKKIADLYHRKAVEFTLAKFEKYPHKELSALPINSSDGQDYLTGMKFAQNFAYHNRQRMLETVKLVFHEFLGKIEFMDEVNIHHNYASEEEHFGRNVWVHRKGAISASKGEWGIIPGSMATNSYITVGKGNPDSFCSASHGAGRKKGRKQSKRDHNWDEVRNELERLDIELIAVKKANAIEEFSQAYKNIDNVLKMQSDLTEVKFKLFPSLVIIG